MRDSISSIWKSLMDRSACGKPTSFVLSCSLPSPRVWSHGLQPLLKLGRWQSSQPSVDNVFTGYSLTGRCQSRGLCQSIVFKNSPFSYIDIYKSVFLCGLRRHMKVTIIKTEATKKQHYLTLFKHFLRMKHFDKS